MRSIPLESEHGPAGDYRARPGDSQGKRELTRQRNQENDGKDKGNAPGDARQRG